MRNEKGEITIDYVEIQKIINTYFEKLYLHRPESTEDTDTFLEMYELPKLNQEDIKVLNNPISVNEIENMIKILIIKKTLGPDDSWLNSTRNLKKI